MEKRKCWIFDVDGTLADGSHRQHYLMPDPALKDRLDAEGKKFKKQWGQWYRRCVDDEPVKEVVLLLNLVKDSGRAIVVCTGRGDMMHLTKEWFAKHNIHYDALYHRKEGDYRDDGIVKSELCDQILADGFEIEAVVDDRPRVVKMWRDRGYFVFDVNKRGEF